jgi:hypothetical protein
MARDAYEGRIAARRHEAEQNVGRGGCDRENYETKPIRGGKAGSGRAGEAEESQTEPIWADFGGE